MGLDVSDGLLSGHLKGVSVLGTQEKLHLEARSMLVVQHWARKGMF